jgi:hypothetical protein
VSAKLFRGLLRAALTNVARARGKITPCEDARIGDLQLVKEGVTQTRGADPPPVFLKVLILMRDRVVCFHTLLKVLILRAVTGGLSKSADSKALAEMATAESLFSTATKGKRVSPYFYLVIILHC